MKLIGLVRLGRDAEMRYTQEGTSVANLALAYNYGKKQNGDQPTQWVDASLWGKRADATAPYLTKGTALVVTLSDVHIRLFDRKDGTQGAALSARVDDFEFAGGRSQQPAQPQNAARGQHAQASQDFQSPREPGMDDDLDDDIPF